MGRRFSSVKIRVYKKRIITSILGYGSLRAKGIKLALENHSVPYLFSGVSEFR